MRAILSILPVATGLTIVCALLWTLHVVLSQAVGL